MDTREVAAKESDEGQQKEKQDPAPTSSDGFVDRQTYARVVKFDRSDLYTKEMEEKDLEDARQELLEVIEYEKEKLKHDKIRNWKEAEQRLKNRKKWKCKNVWSKYLIKL